jgi:alpha-mannosidase
MGFVEELAGRLERLSTVGAEATRALDRFRHEIEFAARMTAARPDRQLEWPGLILQACDRVAARLGGRGAVDVAAAVQEAETLLAPLGRAAKEYTIHCVGHAHIDMNWMWPWPETVSVTHDTFATMDRLMEEIPEFRFSQSQVSVYRAMLDYHPETFERVRARLAEGRWEVTASMWVEGDKNLAAGESLCRHMLYTRRWLKEHLGLDYDAVRIDWECDTFGHAHTLPGILRRGGVSRYYFHRCGVGHRLFWWQGKDGSRVLAFDDGPNGYNGVLAPSMTRLLFDFERTTGLKDMMFVHGVGDHGGGPTRQQLRAAQEMNTWPIFPNIRFSTTEEFYAIAEQQAKELPVVNQELNYVFPGCYTSQSTIKRGNRWSENALVEAEAVALIGSGARGLPYPAASLREAWWLALFNQFHDILPGSGVKATVAYAEALFQEVEARTNAVRTRGLRSLAAAVDTAAVVGRPAPNAGPGLGAGVGEGAWYGGISNLGAGADAPEPFLVFNPSPWTRSEVAVAKIWNRDLPGNQIVVRDDTGAVVPGQEVGRGNYWGHRFVSVAFPARDVPPTGYRVYAIGRSAEPPSGGGARAADDMLENEFLRVRVDPGSGALTELVDKESGYNFVPAGKRLGLVQLLTEAPHGMTAWEIGQIVRQVDFAQGGVFHITARGPHLASATCSWKHGDSSYSLGVALAAGVPRVEFTLNVNWLERGSPEVGVPMLKAAFPLALAEGRATCEVPCGYVSRPTDGFEVPALRWVDLSGRGLGPVAPAAAGATLVNDCKYGHNLLADELRLTLLRGTYDPDPLPELGQHSIRYAVRPHVGDWSASAATRAGREFNHSFSVVGAETHGGELPPQGGFATLETPNVMLCGLKRAEDSEALILRLYEIEGVETEARVWLHPALAAPGSAAVETDLMERPLGESSARMEGEVVRVRIPPFGLATVRVGG